MNKYFKLIILTIFLLLGCTSKNNQKTDNFERKQLFNFNWKFAFGDFDKAENIDFNDSSWRSVDLPHDWSIEGIPDKNNPSKGDGGFFPTGIAWYRKSFKIPSDWINKKVTIYFEGIYMNSEVFINGKSLGKNPYGYTSFYYDLTPFLDSDKNNTIAIRVDNSQQRNCRWYSGSGIYRNVWLIVTEQIHIGHWGVAITTPEITPEKAKVQIKTTVINEKSEDQNILLLTKIFDRNGIIKATDEKGIHLLKNENQEIIQKITLDDPLLWSPEKPYLYKAKLEIKQNNTITDSSNYTFGIRALNFSAENGFLLNGKKVILNGGCVHHDNGCLGAAAYDRAEERKVELLKSAGFNAVRTSHNPPSEAFLDACDRLGLLVINEAFDGWRVQKTEFDYARYFDDWWQNDLGSMLLRDRNHPSIIMWSIGNEIIERTKPEAVETAKKLINYAHQIDSTRPVTSAMTTWGQGWEIFDSLMAAHDVCGYNYQLHHAEDDHQRVPSRVIVHTESYPKDAFYCWNMVKNHEYIIGDFVWTAMDYLGESGIGRYFYPGEPEGEHWQANLFPWHGAYCGDIDLTGWRKPISHYRSMLYNDTEKLYMAVREPNPENGKIKLTSWAVWPAWESWTWPGYEGKNIEVEVYSKYPLVRLYLNEILLGEQFSTLEEEFKASFSVAYEKGELKAVGINDGKEVEKVVIKTAGEASKIELIADRRNIIANGQDLSFVSIMITDKNGILQPNAENHLNFELNGPGIIAGVDNANLKDISPYKACNRKAWHGRAMVIIKSTQINGKIKFLVNSPGLSGAMITINSEMQ